MIPSFPLIWFSLEPPSSHHSPSSSSSSSKTKKYSLFCSWRHFQECCLLPESSTAPLFPYFRLERWTSCVRPFKQIFFSRTKSRICIVPHTFCCQWALQGLQEVRWQARAPQRACGFVCILLQMWRYQFWVASYAHPAISAVLHGDVIMDFSVNYTKSFHNLLFLGQKYSWRS